MHRPTNRVAIKTANASTTYAAQGVCWAVATGAALYLMIQVGTNELSGSPLTIAGMLLLGVGLLKHVKSKAQ